jgi:hypothetical protein
VRGGDFSCKAETSRVRQRLLVRGGDFSCEVEKGSSSGKLVGDAANWLKTGRLASEGLDQGPFSSLSRIFALTLSILAFTLSMVLECLAVFKGDNFAIKGGPNPGPRQPLQPR